MGQENITFIQSPTGGWNARDPLATMPETDAITLKNVFPDTDSCRVKGGVLAYATITGGAPVKTLQNLPTLANGEKFFAASNNKLWDITIGGAPAAIDATYLAVPHTIVDSTWQTVIFKHNIFAVNGSDAPWRWSGTGDATPQGAGDASAWTGPTVTNLINVSSYKSRIYFCEKGTAKVWYGAVSSIQGALSSFDFADVLYKGGRVIFAGSSTKQTTGIDQELFVVVSSEGEVVLYQGLSPADPSWSIVARYFTPKPIGYHCGFYIGSDLHILTQQGIIPLSTLMSNQDVNNEYLMVSGKVAKAFNEASGSYGTNRGWQGVWYPAGHYALINIPLQDAGNAKQYVMNTITKAWCEFSNWHATCFCVFNDVLYYGDKTGGNVYQADVLFQKDPDGTTSIEVKQAFNYCGAPDKNKKFNLFQPMFSAQKLTTTLDTTISAGLDVDFQSSATLSDLAYHVESSAPYINKNARSITGLGKSCAIRYERTFNIAQDIKFFGTWITFEDGGLL